MHTHWRAAAALALVAVVARATAPTGAEPDAELVFAANWLNFTFPSARMYDEYIASGSYENCMLAGVKVSLTGDIFVSVPRWKPGVPSTFNKLVTVDGLQLLQPFPSWSMNTVGTVSAFQSVLGFEIDATNTLWVLDQGKVAGVAALAGSIKLVAIDLWTGATVLTYTFPPELASLNNSFLNDVVVDRASGFAYISDTGLPLNSTSGHVEAGLLVFSIAERRAWRLLSASALTEPEPGLWIEINGERVLENAALQAGADGLALAPDMQTLIWCPLTSTILYSLPTALLRNETTAADEALLLATATSADRGFSSDGLAFTNTSVLLMTCLQGSGVAASSLTFPAFNATLIAHNASEMVWPDTIGFDHMGSILFVSNQLQKFYQDQLVFQPMGAAPATNASAANETTVWAANFRIWRVWVGADSYLAGVFPPPGPPRSPRSHGIALTTLVRVYVLVGLLLFWLIVVTAVVLVRATFSRRYNAITEGKPINMPTPDDNVVGGRYGSRK